VTIHFAGNWSAYLQFAHWAHIQSLEHLKAGINLGDWLGLKSGVGPLAAVPGGLDSSEHSGPRVSQLEALSLICVIKQDRTL
jgi:hypothetical protein